MDKRTGQWRNKRSHKISCCYSDGDKPVRIVHRDMGLIAAKYLPPQLVEERYVRVGDLPVVAVKARHTASMVDPFSL